MIKSFNDLSHSGLSLVGGKIKGLCLLKANGLAVPEFHAIDAQTVKTWLAQVTFDKRLFDIVAKDIQNCDERIFQNVAIRSAVLGEDSESHSFAGIHESVLNVVNREQAIAAIVKVIESAFSPLAIDYRRKNHLNETDILISIVIQKMIQPVFAGVSFGVNLLTGCRQSAWLSVVNGLGDKLVSGKAEGQEFYYQNGKLFSLTSESLQTETEKKFLYEIAQATLSLSEDQKMIMDVEWCYDGQQCWYVQARPVTSLPVIKNQSATVFDNSNIQESYCGVTTPLTFSYASIAYSKVYGQLMELMLISDTEIKKFNPQLSNMLGLVKGRVYYNINSWYVGLLYLPSFGKRKKEMEDMMGLEKPVDFVQGQQFSTIEKIQKIPQMLRLIGLMIYRFARMESSVREFKVWFEAIYQSASIDKIYQQSEEEIFENIKRYQELFLEKWGTPVLNDTKVMMDMGRVKRKLEKYGFQGEIKSLIYGSEIESVKPTLEIHKLSKMFALDPIALNLLNMYKGTELFQQLSFFANEIYQSIKEYISNYGDRCMGELKLETITIRQDPEILFSMIRSYIRADLHKKEALFHIHNDEEIKKIFSEVTDKMNFIERKIFEKNILNLKNSIANRELMRLHRTKNFGLMREYFLALGKHWQQKKYLHSFRDIFFLTQDEIFQIFEGRFYGANLIDVIDVRKKHFESFKSVKVDTQVKISKPSSLSELVFEEVKVGDGRQFKGLACSQGIVEGEVAIVESPDDIEDLHGKILVAERTDPGWTPLFALIKGVVIEKGSMLSHSAVIAREMGIPAVLGINQITKALKTGDVIRLDGTNGNIQVIRSERESRREVSDYKGL